MPKFIAKLAFPLVSKYMTKQVRAQGIGRHTKDEVLAMMIGDLRAASLCLGDKEFIMGDKPCSVDCTMFGFLAGILFNGDPDSPHVKAIDEDLVNLKHYTFRIKERFWPDWENCLYKSTV